jgi:hypothetical protein
MVGLGNFQVRRGTQRGNDCLQWRTAKLVTGQLLNQNGCVGIELMYRPDQVLEAAHVLGRYAGCRARTRIPRVHQAGHSGPTRRQAKLCNSSGPEPATVSVINDAPY